MALPNTPPNFNNLPLPGPAQWELPPAQFELLKQKLLKDRHFDLSVYNASYVQRRLQVCLMRHSCGFLDYVKILDSDPKEYEEFLVTLTVNVTEFFRDPPLWQALETKYLPQILGAKMAAGVRTFRIWSAGCSSGEEPYSIGMVVCEVLEKLAKRKLIEPGAANKDARFRPGTLPLEVTITATDIDDPCLAKAKTALYRMEGLRKLSPHYVEKYFVQDGSITFPAPDPLAAKPDTKQDSLMKVIGPVRGMVTFQHLHFFNDRPLENIDLVFCRNAAIYLTSDMKEKLIAIFHKALAKDGWLVIGKSEMLMGQSTQLFEMVDMRERIFKKARVEA